VVVRVTLGVVLALGLLTWAIVSLWARGAVAIDSPVPQPADAQPMVVDEVLSGDTVVLTSTRAGAQVPQFGRLTARLIGLDAPDLGRRFGTDLDQCFAPEALARLEELLPAGSIVWVTTDAPTRDSSGDWLLNVWGSDGRLVNYLMAVGGYAEVLATAADSRYGEVLADGEHQALVSFGGMRGACR
jgi:endonuclease YncB( thermonuclease family)